MAKKKKQFIPSNAILYLETAKKVGLTVPNLHSLTMLEVAKKEYGDRFCVLFAFAELQEQGWLTDDFQYTEKAVSLLTELEGMFKKGKPVGKDIVSPERAAEYNAIFPERTKIPTSGKWARDDDRSVAESLGKFMELFPDYDWNTILTATELYVAEKARVNYEYMRTSRYFIMKRMQDGSYVYDLATYCAQVVGGDFEPHQEKRGWDERVV